VEPGVVRIEDGFAGAFACDVAAEVGDFPIARKAGAAAYQLAVVLDDARAGVNEVVRGDDLLPSAARQYLVQEALALPHPRWWHVPLVVDEGGKRLAKRTDAVAIAKFRERGVDPREIVGWVARRSGIAVEERATAWEIAGAFEMGRVPRKVVVCGERELGEIGGASTGRSRERE
jgi:glutamyl-tRNA synthetase